MMPPRVIACCIVLIALQGGTSGQSIRSLFNSGKDAFKQTIQSGTTGASNALLLGNKAVQTGTSMVSNGIEKAVNVGRLVVGAGTAITGHTVAVGSSKIVNVTAKVDAALKNHTLGTIVKAGNDQVRKTVSSVNKVTQAALDGVNKVSDASLALTDKARQIGTGFIAQSAKIGAGIGQATIAVGSSVAMTGIDNVFAFGKNVANQVTSGNFNISALSTNLTAPGAKWILNDNSKLALSQLLPALNQTFKSH